MHQDIVDLNAFYLTRLGRVARRIMGQKIRRVWPSVREEVVLGLGYPVPFLGLFREEADRVFAVMPAGQGVMAWPESGGRLVTLADDGFCRSLTAPSTASSSSMASSSASSVGRCWRTCGG